MFDPDNVFLSLLVTRIMCASDYVVLPLRDSDNIFPCLVSDSGDSDGSAAQQHDAATALRLLAANPRCKGGRTRGVKGDEPAV